MWSMVVVVDVPDADRPRSLGLAGPFAGVEEFLGEGALIALDLAVVLWLAGFDPLVSAGVHRQE